VLVFRAPIAPLTPARLLPVVLIATERAPVASRRIDALQARRTVVLFESLATRQLSLHVQQARARTSVPAVVRRPADGQSIVGRRHVFLSAAEMPRRTRRITHPRESSGEAHDTLTASLMSLRSTFERRPRMSGEPSRSSSRWSAASVSLSTRKEILTISPSVFCFFGIPGFFVKICSFFW
jgi:hypothetical protein